MTIRHLTAAAFVVCLLSAPAPAQRLSQAGTTRSATGLFSVLEPVIAQANAATVRVRSDGKDAALGTIVSAEGYILTKASELRGDLSVRLGDGSVLDAELIAFHKPTDLALLKIDMKGLKPVSFADSGNTPRGYWLAAAGSGTAAPTGVGIVSVMTRDLSARDATDMLNNNRGFVGIFLGEKDDADGGAVVEGVSDDGGAAKAGLKARDVIVELDGYEVIGRVALQELLDNYRPGDKVKVKVRRDDEDRNYSITLTGRPGPKNRSDIQNTMGGKLSGRRTGFPSVLQTDMVVDPEDCGGPVVDLNGKVLGISIARAGRVETWVLPSETIRPILADMKAGKYPAAKKVKKVIAENE